MLSDRLLNFISTYWHFACYVGIVPIDFCNKTWRCIPSKRGRKKARFNTFLLVAWMLMMICQMIRYHYVGDSEYFSGVLLCTFGLSSAVVGQALFTVPETDVTDAINSFLFYLEHINREYMPHYKPNNSKYSRILEIGVVLLGGFFVMVLLTTCAIITIIPKVPVTYCCLLPDDGFPLLGTLLVCYALPYYQLLIVYGAIGTWFLFIFIYATIPVPFILLEFRVDRASGSYFSCDKLRKPPVLIGAWRTVQILQQKINISVGAALIPLHTIFTKLVVICAYMVIRHNCDMKAKITGIFIVWGVMSAQFWGTVLLIGGLIYFYGNKILMSWKYHEWLGLSRIDKKCMKKFQKSCCPLAVGYGKMYIIRRLTVLKFFRSISTGVLRALLTLERK